MIAKPKHKQILKLKTQADAFFPQNVVSAIFRMLRVSAWVQQT